MLLVHSVPRCIVVPITSHKSRCDYHLGRYQHHDLSITTSMFHTVLSDPADTVFVLRAANEGVAAR